MWSPPTTEIGLKQLHFGADADAAADDTETVAQSLQSDDRI
jgi:hypothetical protein